LMAKLRFGEIILTLQLIEINFQSEQ